MSSSDTQNLPFSFTPVFDAGNRWAALSVRLAPQASITEPIITQLRTHAETEAGADLPLLFVLDNLQQADHRLTTIRRPVYVQLPATAWADPAAVTELSALAAGGLRFLAQANTADDVAELSADSVAALVVDCGQAVDAAVGRWVAQRLGPHLVVGIGTYNCQQQAAKGGFRWFQGDWPLHPESDQIGHAVTSRSTLLNLLALVTNDAESREIEVLLKRDPNLAYQLLKLVNSVSFSLTHKIESFGQAITLLGRRQLQRWLQLLMYAGHHGKDVSVLLGLAAYRGALLEGMVAGRGGSHAEQDLAFMAGLFSLLDVLFQSPIEDLVAPANLADSVVLALVKRQGELGAMLEIAANEVPAPTEVAQRLTTLGISNEAFLAAQLRASAWSAQVCREI